MHKKCIEMRNFCACMITTSLKIMLPKCVLSMHTTSINQPLHIVHTRHVSATLRPAPPGRSPTIPPARIP